MIIERNETPQELAFTLTLPQLRQAHEIYKKHCFFQDFMECCEERRTEETGLCNLPYQTLEHETDILCKAYELYEKQIDLSINEIPALLNPEIPFTSINNTTNTYIANTYIANT